MEKIYLMDDWIRIENKLIDNTPLIGKERLDRISNLNFVNSEKRHAERILKYMQRGQVFDLPKCIEEYEKAMKK
jgi:hypothetical protein